MYEYTSAIQYMYEYTSAIQYMYEYTCLFLILVQQSRQPQSRLLSSWPAPGSRSSPSHSATGSWKSEVKIIKHVFIAELSVKKQLTVTP